MKRQVAFQELLKIPFLTGLFHLLQNSSQVRVVLGSPVLMRQRSSKGFQFQTHDVNVLNIFCRQPAHKGPVIFPFGDQALVFKFLKRLPQRALGYAQAARQLRLNNPVAGAQFMPQDGIEEVAGDTTS